MSAVDVLSVGRISVDLYAKEPDVGFEDSKVFKSLWAVAPATLQWLQHDLATASC